MEQKPTALTVIVKAILGSIKDRRLMILDTMRGQFISGDEAASRGLLAGPDDRIYEGVAYPSAGEMPGLALRDVSDRYVMQIGLQCQLRDLLPILMCQN